MAAGLQWEELRVLGRRGAGPNGAGEDGGGGAQERRAGGKGVTRLAELGSARLHGGTRSSVAGALQLARSARSRAPPTPPCGGRARARRGREEKAPAEWRPLPTPEGDGEPSELQPNCVEAIPVPRPPLARPLLRAKASAPPRDG